LNIAVDEIVSFRYTAIRFDIGPSIDPKLMTRMLVVAYSYGIRCERPEAAKPCLRW
jgi:hypothetical protein